MPDPARKDPIPGGPSSQPPALEEPTEFREPPPMKPDQSAPEPYSPTGQPTDGARDAKAGNGTGDPAAADPRVLLMLAEAYRHAKPIAGWDGAQTVLTVAGIPAQAPGVPAGEDAAKVLAATVGLLGQHRVWDRFPVPDQA
jgi:catalase